MARLINVFDSETNIEPHALQWYAVRRRINKQNLEIEVCIIHIYIVCG